MKPVEEKQPAGLLQDQEGKELSKKDQLYIMGLMKMLHSKDTSTHIDEILKSAPPEVSIPQAAMIVNEQIEGEFKKKQPPGLETLLLGGVYLVQDLIEVGNAAGFFQVEGEEQQRDIMQATFQKYIEKGLKDGTVDPIELQSRVEPLLNEQQKQMGSGLGSQYNVAAQPDEMTMMEVFGKQREQQGLLKGRQEGQQPQASVQQQGGQ